MSYLFLEYVREASKEEGNAQKVKKGTSLTDLASEYIKDAKERHDEKR